MTDEILVEALNTFECSPDELLELAEDIQAVVPDIPVVVGYEDEEGSGVSLTFALHLFLPSLEFLKGAAYTEIGHLALRYMKKHRQRPHQSGRTHNLVIHSDDGTTLEILSLKPGEEELLRFPPDDDFRRPKPSKRKKPRPPKSTKSPTSAKSNRPTPKNSR